MGKTSWLVSQGPTLAVFAALGGIAWLGHSTGWRLPTLSELRARGGPAAAKEDWCEAHGVPASKCVACRPELGGADPRDWCREHGVPESKCTVCHPEILAGGPAKDWCGEHGLPESQCTICNPGIAVKGEAPAEDRAAAVTLDPSAPAPDPMTCQSHATRVQFASAEAVRKAGLRLAAVEERPMASYLRANGEIEYDSSRLAHVSSRLPGTLFRVERGLGEPVRRGDVLALVDAAEVGRAKAELLAALATADVGAKAAERMRASAEKGLRTRTELLEAEAALRAAELRTFAAEQALLNLGLPASASATAALAGAEAAASLRLLGVPADLAARLGDVRTANLLPILAPLDGVVVERDAVPGEVVEASKALFVVADPRRLWAMIDVRVEDAPKLALGQKLAFRPDGGDDDDVAAGEVSWTGTAADPKTRTVKVRAEVQNPEGRLHVHTFGTARITLRSEPRAVAVPDEAVQWEGCCHVVFVRKTDELFLTRKVRLGARSAGYTEVVAGVLPGEVVVTTGSHVLKSEVLKSRLGAGCTDE